MALRILINLHRALLHNRKKSWRIFYRLEEGFYQALMMHSYKFLIRRFQVHGNNVGVMLLLKAIHMIWLCNTL